MTNMYKYLSGWTININNLPKYMEFDCSGTKTFVEELDRKIFNLMLNDFKHLFSDDYINILERFVSQMKKDNMYVKYHHPFGLGRFYPDEDYSIISLPRIMKHTAMKYLGWIDIDIICCHPTIACEVARRAGGFEPTHLKRYIDERDTILQEVIDYYSLEEEPITRDEAKSLFNIMAYGGGFNTWLNNEEGLNGKDVKTIIQTQFIKDYKIDCQRLKQLIYENNPLIVEKVRTKKDGSCLELHSDELKRRTCSYFYGIIENDILHGLYKFLMKNEALTKRKNTPLEYDGMCIKPRNNVDYQSLINQYTETLKNKVNFNIKMKIKEFDRVIQDIIDRRNQTINDVNNTIEEKTNDDDDDDDVSTITGNTIKSKNGENLKTYDEMKEEFEKTHFKVINATTYVKLVKNMDGEYLEVKQFSRADIIFAYEHLCCVIEVNVKGVLHLKKVSFIETWIKDENMKTYDDMGVYPPPLKTPPNVYNLWTPFRIQTIYDSIIIDEEDEEYVNEMVELWKNHLLILCNNEGNVCFWYCQWVGQALKFPAIKTYAVVFISKEGAGKGTWNKMFAKMLGGHKYLETLDPDRDIWGNFNELMMNAYVIVINEADAKDKIGKEGKRKGGITDDEITINAKFKKPFKTKSYHRFMEESNNNNPLGTSTTNGDRRNVIIKCSDEKIGDFAYFEKLNKAMNDDRVVKRMYDWFISLEGLDTFHLGFPIETSYHRNIKNENRPMMDRFIEHIVELNKQALNGSINKTTNELYDAYKLWTSKNRINYEKNNINFSRELTAFIDRTPEIQSMIETNTKKSNGQIKYRTFNITKLIKHYEIEVEEEEEEEPVFKIHK